MSSLSPYLFLYFPEEDRRIVIKEVRMKKEGEAGTSAGWEEGARGIGGRKGQELKRKVERDQQSAKRGLRGNEEY